MNLKSYGDNLVILKAAFHGTVLCRMPLRHFIRKQASENRSLYFVSFLFHDADNMPRGKYHALIK